MSSTTHKIHGPSNEQFVEAGIPDAPEIREFLDQIAIAAIEGGPLAKPFLDAGAIRVQSQEIMPGLTVSGIAVHKDKLREMLLNPAGLSGAN